MSNKKVLLALVLLAVVAIAIPVMAKQGGVKASTTAVGCNDAQKESNEISCTVRIWVNLSSPNAPTPTASWDYTDKDSGKNKQVNGPYDFGDAWTNCNNGYYYNDIFIGGRTGSHTVYVDDDNGDNVGGDAFLSTCD